MARSDLAADPRFATLRSRVAHIDAVDDIVGAYTRQFDKQPLFERLMRYRVPCAPVRELHEVVNDEHLRVRRAIEWVEHPDLGRIPLPNSPMRYEASEPVDIVPSRRLGQDNDAVYVDWLGLSDAAFASCRRDGVI
jgi:CoA:oxalate CoA-transferase